MQIKPWIMINVSPAQAQADCHLIEFPDGSRALIDAGKSSDANGTALAYLEAHSIEHLRLVVLSHFHKDHYGALIDIIKAGVKVDRVAINLPASREIADVEKPWGCDWEDVQSLLSFFTDHGILYFTPRIGERLIEIKRGGVIVGLEVVCLYNGLNTPVGRTDINDTSIILRLTHGNSRALFAGDLKFGLGSWLAASDVDLKSEILKVPHHGAEALAPNEFLQN